MTSLHCDTEMKVQLEGHSLCTQAQLTAGAGRAVQLPQMPELSNVHSEKIDSTGSSLQS